MSWISAAKKLPELNEWVLCKIDCKVPNFPQYQVLKFGYYLYNNVKSKRFYFTNIDRSWLVDEITHWMPLPKPPVK